MKNKVNVGDAIKVRFFDDETDKYLDGDLIECIILNPSNQNDYDDRDWFVIAKDNENKYPFTIWDYEIIDEQV